MVTSYASELVSSINSWSAPALWTKSEANHKSQFKQPSFQKRLSAYVAYTAATIVAIAESAFLAVFVLWITPCAILAPMTYKAMWKRLESSVFTFAWAISCITNGIKEYQLLKDESVARKYFNATKGIR